MHTNINTVTLLRATVDQSAVRKERQTKSIY